MSNGEVISFYSFKGGVGRTMALVNIAYLLARTPTTPESIPTRRRVLMIDWDLESPGLHYYLYREGLPSGKAGLAQLLRAAGLASPRQSARIPSEPEFEASLSNLALDEFFHRVDEFRPDLDLWFMPHSSSASSRLHDDLLGLDWRAIDAAAPWAIPCLTARLAECFDYVLIDARTGMSDVGFTSGGLIPDKMVFVFTHNRQSSHGASGYFHKMLPTRAANIEAGYSKPLGVFPLPSMIQQGIPQFLDDWFRNQNYGIAGCLHRLLQGPGLVPPRWSVQQWMKYVADYSIPYVPELAFGDQVVTRDPDRDETHVVSKAYARFATLLTTTQAPWNEASPGHSERPGFPAAPARREMDIIQAANYIEQMVHSRDTQDRIGATNVQAVRAVCDALKYEELGPKVIQICRSYSLIALTAENSTDRWGSIWRQYARDVLEKTQTSLEKLARQQLPDGFTSTNQGFWTTELWQRAAVSVWTTNVATVGQSFGRNLNPQTIAAQGAAVKRGVSITRVFVLEPDETPESFAELRRIMEAQINVGIRVFVISRTRFDLAKGDVDQCLGSDDFMLVDDQFIYVTIRRRIPREDQQPPARSIQILNSGVELRIARNYQTQIQAAATEVVSADEIQRLNAVS